MKFLLQALCTLLLCLSAFAYAWEEIGEGTVDYVDIRHWGNDNIAVRLSSMSSGCTLGYFGSGEKYVGEFYSTLLAALHSGKTIRLTGETSNGSSCLVQRVRITK